MGEVSGTASRRWRAGGLGRRADGLEAISALSAGVSRSVCRAWVPRREWRASGCGGARSEPPVTMAAQPPTLVPGDKARRPPRASDRYCVVSVTGRRVWTAGGRSGDDFGAQRGRCPDTTSSRGGALQRRSGDLFFAPTVRSPIFDRQTCLRGQFAARPLPPRSSLGDCVVLAAALLTFRRGRSSVNLISSCLRATGFNVAPIPPCP